MNKITLFKIILPLSFLCIVGAILRFYNLDWGDPFYFHPDERNIASSISQLVFPTQLNPHFFAYGSFPIYLIFITGIIANLFHQLSVTFQQAIVISRIFSAILSLLLIPSIFYIAKQMTHKNSMGILAAACITFGTGFVQYAHFGTFEMWLTFFGFWLFYFCIAIMKTGKPRFVFLAGMCSGILLATKVSSLLLIPLPLFSIAFFFWFKRKHETYETLLQICMYCVLVGFIYIVTNPFVFLDTKSFLDSMHYETQVATGGLPVFYTGEFFNALPIVFQFLHVFPFLLNPIFTITFLFSIVYFFFLIIQERKIDYIFLAIFFLLNFLSQALLYAKWTRYMMPTLPFMYLIIAICIFEILHKKIIHHSVLLTCIALLVAINTFFGIAFTFVSYIQGDTRLAAVAFAQTLVPPSALITSEVYDLGIVPFNTTYQHISLFNFYDLDNHGAVTNEQLSQMLASSDYIILPSQRILKPRLINSVVFPIGNMFYKNLFNGSLGFKKIYETPCDVLCKIVYINDPVFNLEETATVFDRPTLYIFKKER